MHSIKHFLKIVFAYYVIFPIYNEKIARFVNTVATSGGHFARTPYKIMTLHIRISNI